ncbi:AbrB/MazE/SpoVT family DNA-binding domain-containing protein [Thermococcus kodakarensis]|nr:AbrB/MazE/SpoVT family DNA-binding domain-containing protein [Thermococcus kodakarensis]WCN28969.1 AbrB/MazE/SpoVT family DNA-binding domain-containing protein [Thermococcus kodakarensis]WCN31275.1 AbrB/MazE/SpoVT family DNA-binding domain-containing protein [Thermococcus kodakarensis]
MIPVVSIRLKVGPKGQIVIPKVFREAYGIKEGGEVIVEPREDALVIRRVPDTEELLKKLREYHKKRKGAKPAKLGELKGVSLEDEFDEVWGIEE